VIAKFSVPCARCLDPAPIDVDTELSLLLKAAAPAVPVAHTPHAERSSKKAAQPAEGRAKVNRSVSAEGRARAQLKKEPEYEFSSEEADEDHYDGETVVLDPFVREAILLELPIFPLCSEACPGIRPAPQAPGEGEPPPPIDPRLAPLDALRAKLTKMSASKERTSPTRSEKKPTSRKASQKKTKKE
jgi:uncharacterized protein